jgi:thermostable 8-oxoguanine DNA glycosylase
MIDPRDVTDYHRTKAQLEEFLLFCIVAAGKTAMNQAVALERFLGRRRSWQSPLDYVGWLALSPQRLDNALKVARLGQYSRIGPAFQAIGDCYRRNPLSPFQSLHSVQLADLEQVFGIGQKTSRFFVLHTRPEANVACLDTHVLKFLRARGVRHVPNYTPVGDNYARLERRYLAICRELRVDPAEFDLAIWNHYSGQYRELREAA